MKRTDRPLSRVSDGESAQQDVKRRCAELYLFDLGKPKKEKGNKTKGIK